MWEKLGEPDTTVYVAAGGGIVGIAATETARANDGDGPILPEAVHISMVSVDSGCQRRVLAGC
jgi:hypothetical protein